MNMRRELEGRPLIWLALAFMGGMASHFYPVLACVGLGCLLVDRRVGIWALGFGFLVLGVLLGPRQPALITEAIPFSGEVRVVQAPRPMQLGEWAIVEAAGRRIAMVYDADQPVSFGDTLLVRGRIRPLSDKNRQYWRHQSVSAMLNVQGEITQYSKGPPIYAWGQQLRRSFVAYTRDTLGARARAIVQSVCFNHDAELTHEDRDALARSGIIHIISTSGLHVVLVAGFLTFALSLLPMPRWCQVGLLILMLLVYGAAASFRPPMVRSIIMASLWASAYLFKREADGLSATAASAIITLLIMPTAIFDIGFLLSFASITALVMWIQEPLEPVKTALGWMGQKMHQTAVGSLVCSMAAAPLLSFGFRQFSVVGVVANLVVAPLIPIIVTASILAWLVRGVFGEGIMKALVEPLAAFCAGFSTWIGGMPFSAVQTPEVPPWAIFGFYAFGAMLWRPKPRRPVAVAST